MLSFLLSYGVYVALALVFVLGFVRVLLGNKLIQAKIDFTEEFRKKFSDYCNSQGSDPSALAWLTFRSHRMHDSMGCHGLVDYRPPFARYMFKNHSIILNFIPQIRNYFEGNTSSLGIGQDNCRWLMTTVDESLLRFLGVLDENRKEARRHLFNPVEWFREGVKQVLVFPIYFLSSLGLFSPSWAARAEGHVVFRMMSGVVAILGIVASAMTIVLGREEAWAWVKSVING